MKGNVKHNKDPVKVRPVISHRNAPMSRSSKRVSTHLANNVGSISRAHVKNTRDFHERVRRSEGKGRMVSLDVVSLYTNIPVDESIEVVKSYSTGTNPLFDLPIEANVFCEILSICTSFNQFSFEDKHYRQI